MKTMAETFDLEEALRELRLVAESDPSTDDFRKIHSLHHAAGILVLCRDAGCEVIAEVAMVDGGRNRVLVDGIDIAPNDGGALMTEHLTPTQLITLTAVLDAIVDQEIPVSRALRLRPG